MSISEFKLNNPGYIGKLRHRDLRVTPLLETVENGRSMPNSEFTWKISVDTTTRISPDEFKLTYYGIQLEPVNPGAVSLWWFLVGGGALLLALAFWVKKRRK